jgi:hypothetical protein
MPRARVGCPCATAWGGTCLSSRGSALGGVRLVDLATHTAGGFPLQVPDAVKDGDQLMAYFRAWTPQAPAGTSRVYANPSIGLLGMASARAMGEGFEALMERRLFPELGLRRTYVAVPEGEMRAYAWGYNREGKPVRVNPGQLASEAYGVKSNAVDMARFLEVNMGVGQVPPKVARAVAATHLGHYRAEGVTQALIWEWYPLPVEPDRLVAGNSLNLRAVHATAVEPPARPGGDVLVNKTGSTNGFGAYVAFIPGKRLGIVMLANQNYPNEARVRAAHGCSRASPSEGSLARASEVTKEVAGHASCRLLVQLDEGKLGRAVDSHEEVQLALLRSDLRDVDVEEADRVALEPGALRPVPVRLGQPADAVALEAAMQAGSGEIRNGGLESVEAVVERQQRVAPEGDDDRLVLGGEDRGSGVSRPGALVGD